jgi:hypothetical protein
LKVQEELEQILLDEAKIECKEEQLVRLESSAMRMTAAMDGEIVSRTRNNDPLGTYKEQKEKLEKEIAWLRTKNERRKEFLSGIIDGLRKKAYIKILYGLFFNAKELDEVANEIGYSYRHTQDLRDIAIQEVQKIMDESEKFS